MKVMVDVIVECFIGTIRNISVPYLIRLPFIQINKNKKQFISNCLNLL